MYRLKPWHSSLCNLLALAVATSPLSMLPQVAAAAQMDQCLALTRDNVMVLVKKAQAGGKTHYSRNCSAPDGTTVAQTIDLSLHSDGQYYATLAPTQDQIRAMVPAAASTSNANTTAVDRGQVDVSARPVSGMCLDLPDLTPARVEAEADFNANRPLPKPQSRRCYAPDNSILVQTIYYEVDNGQLTQVITPSMTALRAMQIRVNQGTYNPAKNVEDNTLRNTLIAVGGLVAVTVGGVIIWKMAARSGARTVETALEDRTAAYKAGQDDSAAVVQSTRSAKIAPKVTAPKSVDLARIGVPNGKGRGTIAGVIPMKRAPKKAPRFTDPRTGNVYISQADPTSNLIYWFLLDRAYSQPYFYPGSYWYSNGWAYNPMYNPYMWGGNNTEVIINQNYANPIDHATRTYSGDAVAYGTTAADVIGSDSRTVIDDGSGRAPFSGTDLSESGARHDSNASLGGGFQPDNTPASSKDSLFGGNSTDNSNWSGGFTPDPTPAPAPDFSTPFDPGPSSGGGGFDSGSGGFN